MKWDKIKFPKRVVLNEVWNNFINQKPIKVVAARTKKNFSIRPTICYVCSFKFAAVCADKRWSVSARRRGGWEENDTQAANFNLFMDRSNVDRIVMQSSAVAWRMIEISERHVHSHHMVRASWEEKRAQKNCWTRRSTRERLLVTRTNFCAARCASKIASSSIRNVKQSKRSIIITLWMKCSEC